MTEPIANPKPPARSSVAHAQSEDGELIMFLERDQLVADTSRPVPRAHLGPRASAALWGLRVFVLVVSFMVIYAFVRQLR